MPKAEELTVNDVTIGDVAVTVSSYRIGDRCFCHVANKDPGATIARAEASSIAEARTVAISKAEKRLTGTPSRRITPNK